MQESLHDHISGKIASHGPMDFSEFMQLALYDRDRGFYASGGRAGGRVGDFVTSVEAGPLFGAVVADWLDAAWRLAGEPDTFRVSEVGAGVGTLFRAIVHASPACLDSLRYRLVESSASMRVSHQSLPGDRWESAASLGDARQHVVLSNELLDNMPFDIAERAETEWISLLVATRNDEFVFVPGHVRPSWTFLNGLVPNASVGSRVPVSTAAARWIGHALQVCDRLLAFDYAASTQELANRGQAGWLRTYAQHHRGHNPLRGVGECDITHDVPFDQLPAPSLHLSQAEWLQANGIDARVAHARAVWDERAHIGDLKAMIARSAIGESQALLDPTGLGAFHALEWHQGTP